MGRGIGLEGGVFRFLLVSDSEPEFGGVGECDVAGGADPDEVVVFRAG